jgi:osmoprotectant transport system substrate-binding protein
VSRTRTRLLGLVGAGASLALLTACGLGTAGGFVRTGELAGPIADVERFDGAELSVGSKNFTEQVLLGKIAVILLRSAGADATDLTNIPGSASARAAQREGQVNVMWEYTGTAWISYLGHPRGIPDEDKQYRAVREEDRKKNDLVWLEPAPMNNTYGFAVTQENAKKLSDLADVPKAERTFCVESEFANRNDGLEPMLKAYDVPLEQEVPRDNINILDTGAIYAATAKGTCNFGEVFTTDGRIKALNLKVLEDDRKFFPAYNVSVVVNEPQFQEHPQIEELFGPVAQQLDNATLLELNAKVDVEGKDPAVVAFDWLKSEGFIE